MFEEMTKFFGNDPDAHVIEVIDHSGIVLVIPDTGMTELPVKGEDFKIGPYRFSCLSCSGGLVVGYIATPTL